MKNMVETSIYIMNNPEITYEEQQSRLATAYIKDSMQELVDRLEVSHE